MDLLVNYVQETRGTEYAAADSLLKRGKICPEYVQYLFRPNDVLISIKKQEYTIYVAIEWPTRDQLIRGTNDASTWTILAQIWEADGVI
jgi:hypothetical protein